MARRPRPVRSHRRNSWITRLFKFLGMKPPRGGGKSKKAPWVVLVTFAAGLMFAGPAIGNILSAYFTSPCESGRYQTVVAGINDTTDKLPYRYRTAAREVWVEHVPNMFARGTNVRLFSITGQREAPLKEIFRGCSTKTGKDANFMLETGSQLDREWAELFGAPYSEAVDQLPTDGADYTPLLEAVHDAYRKAERSSDQVERILIPIVSDALIHLPSVSAYRRSGSRSLHDAGVQTRLLANVPELSRAEIILYLAPPVDGTALSARQESTVQFLERYFRASGAQFTVRAL